MASVPIVWRSDPGYEAARTDRLWNKRIPERYPDAVVQATKEDDIVEAVKLAKRRGCKVAVRSGGHSWAASSVRDCSVLIDLEQLRQMSYNEDTGVATVSPSVTSKQLTDFLLPKGRMFAGGHCPDVALGGFLLQGGVGWNARGWGWACEQITAIDVVTGDGEVVRADASQNSDLYWAVRGCGPGFPGVILRFYLQTRPAPEAIHTSAYIYPVSEYESVFSWILQLAPTLDLDIELVFAVTQAPDNSGPCLAALLTAFKDTVQDAQDALRSAESSHPQGTLVHLFDQPTSLAQEYEAQMRLCPPGRYFIENAYIHPGADLVPLLKTALTTIPSPESYSFWYHMPRPHGPDMALSLRTEHYLALYTICKDEQGDAACQAYARDIITGLRAHTAGAYLGDIDLQERTTRFWGEEEGKRLMEIRKTRDPEGRFCGYLNKGDTERGQGLNNKL